MAMTPDLRLQFVEGMSRVAAAVTVVTTDGEAGRFGVTVSSMTSVSADTRRPSLLISVHHMSPACDAIKKNRRFCANVLSGAQSGVSDLFSGRLKHVTADRFGAVEWRSGATGAPILADALVSFDCELKTALLWGTHFIFIGEVEQIDISEQRSPLVYANRGYRRAVPIGSDQYQPQPAEQQLRIGFFMTLGPQFVPGLVADFSVQQPQTEISLLEADHDDLIEQLRAGRIDAALTHAFTSEPDLEFERISPPAPHVILAEGHPLAGRERLSLAEISALPMVLLDLPSVRAATVALFERNGLKPVFRFQSPSFAMVRGLVAQGLGYSIVPQGLRSNAGPDGKRFRTVPLQADFPEAAIVSVVRRAGEQKGPTRQFLARCRERVGAGPSQQANHAGERN